MHKNFDDIERRQLIERAWNFRGSKRGDVESDKLIADLAAMLLDAHEKLATYSSAEEVERKIADATAEMVSFEEAHKQVDAEVKKQLAEHEASANVVSRQYEGKSAKEWHDVHVAHIEAAKNALNEAARTAKHEGKSAEEWYRAARATEERSRVATERVITASEAQFIEEDAKWRSCAAGLLGLSGSDEKQLSGFDIRVKLTDHVCKVANDDAKALATQVSKLESKLAQLKQVEPCAVAFAMTQHTISLWDLQPDARQAVEIARALLEVE